MPGPSTRWPAASSSWPSASRPGSSNTCRPRRRSTAPSSRSARAPAPTTPKARRNRCRAPSRRTARRSSASSASSSARSSKSRRRTRPPTSTAAGPIVWPAAAKTSSWRRGRSASIASTSVSLLIPGSTSRSRAARGPTSARWPAISANGSAPAATCRTCAGLESASSTVADAVQCETPSPLTLRPLAEGLADSPRLVLDEIDLGRLANGQRIPSDDESLDGVDVAVLDRAGALRAVVRRESAQLRPIKVIAGPNR